jgi:hypothetical protein
LDFESGSREGREEGNHGGPSAFPLTAENSSYVTTVLTEFKAKDCHHRIIFGAPVKRSIVLRRRGHLKVRQLFSPGARFVLDLWRRNSHGTLQWRCFVCEAVAPGELAQRVPRVIPGARILLATQGAAESKLFLTWLYQLAHGGVDVLQIPREAFEAAHFRLKGSRVHGLPVNTLSGRL